MNTFSTSTDDTLRETIQHGDSRYPFAYYLEDIWQYDFHCVDWHWHHELEFMTVREGTVLCLIGSEKLTLPKGSGIFINSGVLHRFESRSSAIIPNIVFSPVLLSPEKSLIYEKYVRPVISSSSNFQVLDLQIPWQGKILSILEEIYGLQNQKGPIELQTVQSLLEMWKILFQNFDISPNSPDLKLLNPKQARLLIMMQYIHDHYQEELSLSQIAASASVSKSGALQLFQSGIQLSPVAYLIQYRLSQAAELLHTTAKSISAIAEETGFSSAGYFCRRFKERYQMTPNEYRNKE